MKNGKVYIADCHLGKGIFAAADIQEGATLFAFAGPLISFEAAIAKGERQGDPLQVDTELYMDVGPPGVYINHSCDPNAGLSRGCKLVALRAIRQGEEIRMDYSTTMYERSWTMACDCRSGLCRRTIRDFDTLPIELQEKYLGLGVVADFIVEELRASREPTAGMRAHAGERAHG